MSNRSFPTNSLLNIELTLSRVRKVIKTKGEVRWVRTVEGGELFEMGIKFLDLYPESLVELLEYCYTGVHQKNLRR